MTDPTDTTAEDLAAIHAYLSVIRAEVHHLAVVGEIVLAVLAGLALAGIFILSITLIVG